MVDSLSEFIKQVSSDKRVNTYNETRTKQAIISKILSLLDWDTADPDEVTLEHDVENFKVDYALGNHKNKFVFIEVKKPSEDLSRHQDQVVRYAFMAGMKHAILTNGLTWQFYLPQYREGDWNSKKFYEVTLTSKKAQSTAQKFKLFLSRENVLSQKSKESAERLLNTKWKNQKIDQALPEAWNKLLKEHNPVLISLISKSTQKISKDVPSQKQIENFIDRCVLNKDNLHYSEISSGSLKMQEGKSSSSIARKSTPKKEISKLKFNGKTFSVHSYREALFKIITIVKNNHPSDFPKILKLHGTKRPYFSKTKEDLVDPKKIPGTEYYCMTNLSAKSIERLIKKILEISKYKGSFELL